jgi:hypothetical protein
MEEKNMSKVDDAATPLPEAVAADLKDRLAAFNDKHEFSPGDLVRQKAGLRRYIRPDPGYPAIVREIFPMQGSPADRGGDDLYEEDMVIMTTNDDGVCFYTVDSRCFEPWTPAT